MITNAHPNPHPKRKNKANPGQVEKSQKIFGKCGTKTKVRGQWAKVVNKVYDAPQKWEDRKIEFAQSILRKHNPREDGEGFMYRRAEAYLDHWGAIYRGDKELKHRWWMDRPEGDKYQANFRDCRMERGVNAYGYGKAVLDEMFEKYFAQRSINKTVFQDKYRELLEHFSKSLKYTSGPGNLKSEMMRQVHESQAAHVVENILQKMRKDGVRPAHYDLRVTADRDYNENSMTQSASNSTSAFNDRFVLDNSHDAKNHLYIEALMSLEPLIDAADYEMPCTKMFNHRTVRGTAYDFQEFTAFDTPNKRALYFTELATAVLRIFKGFEKVRTAQSFTKDTYGPDPEALVQWYLAHIGNMDKHGVVMYKGNKLRLSANISENSKNRWYMKQPLKSRKFCKFSYSSNVFKSEKGEELPEFEISFHQVNQDPKLISELRIFLESNEQQVHEEEGGHSHNFGEDLKQFILDYNNIRDMWYNVEKFPTRNRSKVDNASQIAMYIQFHPYFQATATKQGPGSNWVKGNAAEWISKTICLMDTSICSKFVNLVESGMTVYDWPLFAVQEMRAFLEGRVDCEIGEAMTHVYQGIFSPAEKADIERVLKLKESKVQRAHFLPQVKKGKKRYAAPEEKSNKKRKQK